MKFVNKKQVCAELGICGDTFKDWVRQGLPEYRIGRTILVKQEELASFIEGHGTGATAELVSSLVAEVLATPKRKREGRRSAGRQL